MSDVGFYGVVAALGALATLALGGVATLLAIALGAIAGEPPRIPRIARFAAGPLACLAVGAISLVVALTATGPAPDAVAWAWPVAGIAVGVAVAWRVNRRARTAPRS